MLISRGSVSDAPLKSPPTPHTEEDAVEAGGCGGDGGDVGKGDEVIKVVVRGWDGCCNRVQGGGAEMEVIMK